jgi:hypothetical protein
MAPTEEMEGVMTVSLDCAVKLSIKGTLFVLFSDTDVGSLDCGIVELLRVDCGLL